MLKDREKLYQIYHTVLCMALTWAFVLLMNQYYSLRINILLSALLSFIPPVLIYLFDLNKKNVISYILIGSIPPLLALIFWIRKINPVNWFTGLVNWCETYNGSDKLYKLPYAVVAVLGLAILGAILFYIFTANQMAKEVLAVVIFVVILILCIKKINVNKAIVGICVFYILTIVVEFYGIIYSRKAGRQERREGILYLAPICLLLAVLSISLPSKQEPIQWTVARNVYNNISEQMEIWQTQLSYYFGHSKGEFCLNLSGYTDDDTTLGTGGIDQDNRVALKLYNPQQEGIIYLIGSVSDIYTGSSWEKSRQDSIPGEKEYLLDDTEMFLALTREDKKVLESNFFLKSKNIKIEYNDIMTRTIFYPLLTSEIEVNSGYKKLSEEASQITSRKARGKGTKYNNVYYDMNLDGSAFQNMLRREDSFSYKDVNDIDQNNVDYVYSNIMSMNNDYIYNRVIKKDVYKVLGERAELIKAKYTTLPKELPHRVRKLAVKITQEYSTKYDKLKAIEAYLKGYKYTLQPGKLPKGKDYTDDFLFVSKEGYCTSFATAMAVLGRCIGVPMRYVEGFAAKCDTVDNYDRYLVKNSQAHAWAEGYLEGVGWIPFEATAPYYDSRYTKWPEMVKENDNIDADSGNSSYEYQKFPQQMYQPVKDKIKTPEKKNSGEALNIVMMFLAVFVGLMLVIFTCYHVMRLRFKKAFDRADYSRKMYLQFLRILRFLKKEGFTLKPQETILMFSSRVKNYLQFDEIKFQDVADIYMRYRYAQMPVTKEELARVEAYSKGLSDKQKAEEKWWKVWLFEFVFLIQIDRQLKRRYNNT